MRSSLPEKPIRAALFGLGLWLAGMVIGTVVFSVPALKSAPAIPLLTANAFITLPVIAVWALGCWVSARGLVGSSAQPRSEGLRIGLLYFAVNALLDAVLVAGLMGAGLRFYSYLGLWAAYAILIGVPVLAGRFADPSLPAQGAVHEPKAPAHSPGA